MSAAPRVDLCREATPAAVCADFARRFVDALLDCQTAGRVASVALTGGSVAEDAYRAVLDVPQHRRVDWAAIDVWWGDERFLAASDPDRNAVQARRALLDHLPFAPERVHEMPASDGERGVDLDAAAAAYGATMRALGSGGFDVVLLGMGPDGHVASLFPGYPQLDVDDEIAVGVRNSPKPPPDRISLTFAALERAREVWFLVTGEAKAEAVKRALTPGMDFRAVPAARPRGRERTVWLLDEAAASLV